MTPSLFQGEAGRLFLLLCALNLLNYIDRAAVSGLLEPIRRDLGATDAQIGLVGSAFLLTYAFTPPVFGWIGTGSGGPGSWPVRRPLGAWPPPPPA